MSFTIRFSYRTEAHSNLRGHTRAKAKKVKAEREAMRYAWLAHGKPVPDEWPVVVHLVRIAPRPLDDDNLRSAFKAMRDELVECWGLADDSGRSPVRFTYAQRTEGAAYGVEIEVDPDYGEEDFEAAEEILRAIKVEDELTSKTDADIAKLLAVASLDLRSTDPLSMVLACAHRRLVRADGGPEVTP